MAKDTQRELGVFTSAKKVVEYVLVATKNAPKVWRWNVVDKIVNCAVEVVEILYAANAARNTQARGDLQREADTKLKFLGYLVSVANGVGVLTVSQSQNVARLIIDTRRDLYAWMAAKTSGVVAN
jgi:hypothetical protein